MLNKIGKIFNKLVISLFCMSQFIVSSPLVSADNPATGKIVVKETGQGGLPLGGAMFDLKNNIDGITVSQKTEAQTGETTFSNIKPGTYTLTETQSPSGYKKTSNTWTVTVEENGKTTAVGADVGEREEVLSDQYPTEGTYQDDGSKYTIITVNDPANQNDSKVGEEFKAVNPSPYERNIEEGSLSKRIYKVNNLSDNQYGIELTVSGKTTVETKENSVPLDVVILLDNSNSMSNIRYDNARRAEKAGEATRALVDRITSNPDNRVALVTYGSTIFDGTQATVEKGVADKNGKVFNDSLSWPFNRTTFTATTRNYSFLNLTSNPDDIQTLKERVPSEAEELDKDILMYQFGATFTQKALMKANDILTQQARGNSKKVIFHITDGVPTISYPINFNNAWNASSYKNQLNSFLAKSQYGDGILLSDYITQADGGEHTIVRGDGESYQMFVDKTIYTQGQPAAYPVPQDQLAAMKAAGYAISGNYIDLYWRDSLLAYPFTSNTAKITNHGDPTRWYFNGNIKPKGYDIFTVGIGVNGDPGATPEQATSFMQSISSKPENYTNVTDASKVLEELNRYFYTIVTEKKSIENGSITDPMGDLIDFQLGENNVFSPDDYTLTASDGSRLENGSPVGGPQGDGGLLKDAKVFYDNSTKKIRVTGLYLGTDEKVTLTYNVRLNDQFVSNQFYDTNGRTTLQPKEVSPNTVRDFPIPKIRDVRKYPEVTVSKEKQLGEIEFIKINKNTKAALSNAVFTLQKENTNYGIFFPVPNYQQIKTDSGGKIKFVGLEDGKYKLFENSAPNGYKPVQNKPIVELQVENGEVKNVTSVVPKDVPAGYELTDGKHYITNNPIPPKQEYPHTGGIGLLPFYLVGCTLMVGALVCGRRYIK